LKTCIKCGLVGEESEFTPRENLCKACKSKRKKEWDIKNAEHVKSYTDKYRNENKDRRSKSKKEWDINNSEHVKSYAKEYRKDNKEHKLITSRAWIAKNIEHVTKKNKEKYANDPDKVKAAYKQWAKNNPDKIKEYGKRKYNVVYDPVKARERQNAYRHTPAGNANMRKHNHARRGLGHNPLNVVFKDSEEHHLRYSNSAEDKDNDMTIYVPKELHKSIRHNGNTGKNMREINIACLEWYFANTPAESRNKKALDLYLKYCMLPEPTWKSESLTA